MFTLLTVLACACFVAAGLWQLGRASEKREQQRAIEASRNAEPVDLRLPVTSSSAHPWQHVRVRGRFSAAATIYLDNRVLRGTPGYHVVTPIEPVGAARLILVNRGWVAAGASRDTLPQIETPAGLVSIDAFVSIPPERVFELGTHDPATIVWPNLTLARYENARRVPLEPIVLLQRNDLGDGLIRQWEPPASGAARNQGYALQWFAFALLAASLYVGLNLKRGTR